MVEVYSNVTLIEKILNVTLQNKTEENISENNNSSNNLNPP